MTGEQMAKTSTLRTLDQPFRHFAVVLGTNEIASAVAVHLHRAGWDVVLSHDPHPPVIRRMMAFHDALFGDPTELEGIVGERADTGIEVLATLAKPNRVAVTGLGLTDLLVIRRLDALIDARMQKYRVNTDFRGLARLTLGLGPGFSVDANCDVAIETRPAKNGRIVYQGPTDAADGIPGNLGNAGSERFVYSTNPGLWHSAIEIGARTFRDFVVGYLDGEAVAAPFDGVVRGIVRDGMEVPAGVKLLEVDPRGRHARWTGIDDRGRTIAKATLNAIRICAAQRLLMDMVATT
jgi:xanthine dehydrogenase accessory factor